MAKPKKYSGVPKQKVSLMLGVLLVLLLLVAQICFDKVVWHRASQQQSTAIAQMILNAADGLRTPTVVEPQTGKLYVPAAKLVLPTPADDVRNVTYQYLPSSDDFPGEVMFTSDQLVSEPRSKFLSAVSNYPDNPNDFFGYVPELQACTRGLHVTFGVVENNEMESVGQKKLSDGRSVTFYKEAGCKVDQTHFTDYIKQVDSY